MRDLLGEFIAAECDDMLCHLLLLALADETQSYVTSILSMPCDK